MAKSSNGGSAKGTGTETKARRAPARRTAKKSADAVVASAPEMSSGGHVAGETAAYSGPSADEIRRRAYEIYVRRGRTNGNDKDDWFEAERQLRARTH